MKSDISKLICTLFRHLSSVIFANIKDYALIIPEILEFIELHTYTFRLVYVAFFLRVSGTEMSSLILFYFAAISDVHFSCESWGLVAPSHGQKFVKNCHIAVSPATPRIVLLA